MAELEDAKRRQLSSLDAQQGKPSFLAARALLKDLYGDTPYGVVSATPASTRAFTVDAVRAFYARTYAPQNTVIVLAGDITVARAVAMLTEQFGAWSRTPASVRLPPVSPGTTSGKVILIDRPGSVQTNLLIGRLGIDRRDPEYIPITVTNNILGTGAAGRLFMNLREEKSYTYGAYSGADAGDYRGIISASSEVRSAVTEGALEEFFHEFERLGSEPVSAEELARHQRSIVASFAMSLESPDSLMNYVYIQDHYGFPEDYWDRYPSQIDKVSSEDVMRIGQKYFRPGLMHVIAVGDPAIRSALQAWGPPEDQNP